jgi:hypothetical protein
MHPAILFPLAKNVTVPGALAVALSEVVIRRVAIETEAIEIEAGDKFILVKVT